jgi:hypothetical protein
MGVICQAKIPGNRENGTLKKDYEKKKKRNLIAFSSPYQTRTQ